MDAGESHPRPPTDPVEPSAGIGGRAPRRLLFGALVLTLGFGAGALLFSRVRLHQSLGLGATCGNGEVERNEECDDGNRVDEDGCLTTCVFASCGDGVRRTYAEECDDGNRNESDGCGGGCLLCPTSPTSFSSADNGHCYWREPEARTYSEASEVCGKKRGYLATYGSDTEWRLVTDHLIKGIEGSAWIGLRQEERNGVRDFAWVSGERLLASHWAVHEPRRDPSFICAAQSAQGTWVAAPCDEKRQFVCERPRWMRLQGAAPSYRRFAERLTWDGAAAICAENGGRLVMFRNQGEQQRLSQRFPGPWWIGARIGSAGGDFAWLNGEPLSYRDFAPGEPNLLRVQHCVALEIDGRWYNRECSDRNRFVCEIP